LDDSCSGYLTTTVQEPDGDRPRVLAAMAPVVPGLGWYELRAWLALLEYGPGQGRPLIELRFIHYLRFGVLDRLPAPDGSGSKGPRLNSSFLVVDACYEGPERAYIDTFTDVLPQRLAKIFSHCVGFKERVIKGAEMRGLAPAAFRQYIADGKLDVLDFHAAYSQTVTDTRQAIVSEEAHRRMVSGPPARARAASAEMDQVALGSLAARFGVGETVLEPWARAVTRRYGVCPFVVATPIRPGAEDAVQNLRALGLLKDLPGAHFSRLVLIPTGLKDFGQAKPDRLRTPYLLFSANHHGPASDYLEGIRASPAADEIWGHCAQYPKRADKARFHRWFQAHTLSTQYHLAGYAPRSIRFIEHGVAKRRDARRMLADPATRSARIARRRASDAAIP
jgi:hypothetical protein